MFAFDSFVAVGIGLFGKSIRFTRSNSPSSGSRQWAKGPTGSAPSEEG